MRPFGWHCLRSALDGMSLYCIWTVFGLPAATAWVIFDAVHYYYHLVRKDV